MNRLSIGECHRCERGWRGIMCREVRDMVLMRLEASRDPRSSNDIAQEYLRNGMIPEAVVACDGLRRMRPLRMDVLTHDALNNISGQTITDQELDELLRRVPPLHCWASH